MKICEGELAPTQSKSDMKALVLKQPTPHKRIGKTMGRIGYNECCGYRYAHS